MYWSKLYPEFRFKFDNQLLQALQEGGAQVDLLGGLLLVGHLLLQAEPDTVPLPLLLPAILALLPLQLPFQPLLLALPHPRCLLGVKNDVLQGVTSTCLFLAAARCCV